MMRRLSVLSAAALALTAGTASATPLRLDYCIQATGPGQFRYTFTLTLDNNDNSWAPGQGWGWLIFGDASGQTSPFNGFTPDPGTFPLGPWTGLTSSGGGHNGPTFDPVVGADWVPSAVGDSLTWSGTAPAYIAPPGMKFSTLQASGGAVPANFEVAVRVACAGLGLGACCLPDGSCLDIDTASCTALGGVFSGKGSSCGTTTCAQPPTGACCLTSGCMITNQFFCAANGGTFQGVGTGCGGCAPATEFIEFSDAGSLPGSAAVANNGSGTLSAIRGRLETFSDVDMYRIRICDPANFSAALTGLSIGEVFLFKEDGMGVANRLGFNGPATLTNQFTSALPAGDYYLAIAAFLQLPRDNGNQYLWATNFDNLERAPDGPGAANPIDNWDGGGGLDGAYLVTLSGACFVAATGPVCYPNCDSSTTLPCLNVQDFQCFLNSFASGQSYANCDASTTPPVLNVQDFQCFLNSFSTGCSSC